MSTPPQHPVHTAHAEPSPLRWTVRRGEQILAESDQVLMVVEHYDGRDAEPVPYFPPNAIDTAQLSPSDHETTCPVKGTAAYHSVTIGSQVLENAVWSYPNPNDNLSEVAGHMAFYPDRFTISSEQAG